MIYPDVKPSHIFANALVAVAVACAPVKSAPPVEPTPVVRNCEPGEVDGGRTGIHLRNNGETQILVTGNPLYGSSAFRIVNRGGYLCAKIFHLDFGSPYLLADPRA